MGEGERKRIFQADFLLSAEPDVGLSPTTRDHDLSRNQESALNRLSPPDVSGHALNTLVLVRWERPILDILFVVPSSIC